MSGKLGEYCYTSDLGSTVTKSFCSICGSPVCGRNSRISNYVTITLGSLDNAQELDVQVVIFDREKQHWDQLGESVSVYEAQPEFTPKE
jgi:hypothetical protein